MLLLTLVYSARRDTRVTMRGVHPGLFLFPFLFWWPYAVTWVGGAVLVCR